MNANKEKMIYRMCHPFANAPKEFTDCMENSDEKEKHVELSDTLRALPRSTGLTIGRSYPLTTDNRPLTS